MSKPVWRAALALPLLLLLFGWPALASQVAVLQSGARFRARTIERDGSKLVLTTDDGRIELDATLVERIEVEADPPPPAPAAPVAAPVVALAPIKSPDQLIREVASRYGLPPEIVRSVAMAESGLHQEAVSRKGAIGVMQLMPATARELNADPKNLEQNIEAGTRLLRDLLVKYQDDPSPVRRALAAYNAGSGAVQRYNGVPPYRETQDYVERVIRNYWREAGKAAKESAAAATASSTGASPAAASDTSASPVAVRASASVDTSTAGTHTTGLNQ